MNVLKNIFTAFMIAATTTSGVFAAQNCTDQKYREIHFEECDYYEFTNQQKTILSLLGGAVLLGVGISLANQTSGDSNSTGSHSPYNNTFTLQRSPNTYNNNYSLSYIYAQNSAQFESVKLTDAFNRNLSGKNISVAVIDDFNTDSSMNFIHGDAVTDIVKYVAPDANITNQYISQVSSNGYKTFSSFDDIAKTMKNSAIANIYNNSWQIESTKSQNAATIQNQQQLYKLTSHNFIDQVIDTAINKDAIFVWAAGNDWEDESGAISAMPLVFTEMQGHFVNVVAYNTKFNTLASYSNQCGVTKEYCIAAPGSALTTNSADETVSGTSFAAPIVSGAIAVIKEAFPYMTANQITELLFTTAQDLGETGVDEVYGWGLLDMEKATRPVGEAKVVLADNGVQDLDDSSVGGMAAAAIKRANIKLAFVDDFGRAFTTNLSDNVKVVPYGRGFEKLQSEENDSIALSKNVEFGFKQNKFLEATCFVQSNQNSLTNFVGYKNEFNVGNVKLYQNARFGMSAPKNEYNSVISGFSNIYTASMKIGAQWKDFGFEIAMPETIVQGNAYLTVPVARANNGSMVYSNATVDLKTAPSTEYTISYKSLSATYVNNPEYQDEFYILAKSKIAF